MEKGGIYSKYKGPERREPANSHWSTEEELLDTERINENVTFSIPLEEGDPDRFGEREPINEVTVMKGYCYINGKKVRPIDAGNEVVKYNKQDKLTEEQKKILMIDKILTQRSKK